MPPGPYAGALGPGARCSTVSRWESFEAGHARSSDVFTLRLPLAR